MRGLDLTIFLKHLVNYSSAEDDLSLLEVLSEATLVRGVVISQSAEGLGYPNSFIDVPADTLNFRSLRGLHSNPQVPHLLPFRLSDRQLL